MADAFSVIYSSIRARIRGGSQNGQETLVDANQAGQLITADGLPRYTESSRRFAYLQVQTSTLLQPLNAVPTETMVYETVRVAASETRRSEFQALSDFYQSRANLYRGGP